MSGRLLKIGLALAGGAARGLVHLGVLQAFEEAEIPISVITGTSMGALIGAMYAVQPKSETVRRRIKEHLESAVFQDTKFDSLKNWREAKPKGVMKRLSSFMRGGYLYSMSFTRPSMVSEEAFFRNIAAVVEDIDISNTKIKFACAALDINSGQEIVLQEGSLRRAVQASCALPGMFPPVPWNSYALIDGGWVDNVPVVPAFALGADIVAAVNPLEYRSHYNNSYSGMDVVIRADEVARATLTAMMVRKADCQISPRAEDLPWHGFSDWEEFYRRGLQEARERIPELKALLRRRRLRRIFFGC